MNDSGSLIFTLRLLVFSFFIILGFHISVCSIKGRGAVSLIYGCVLLYYTFLCRVHLTVDVAASDYGHAITTQRSVGESIWRIVKAIFGMDSSGYLAGVYWQASLLNILLFVPLGYLVLLHFLCGDTKTVGSSDSSDCRVNEVATTSQSEKRTLAKIAFRTEMICIATSFVIEVTQKITKLGMFDINDLIANSIGSCIGIGMVWLWQHFRSLLIKSQEVI